MKSGPTLAAATRTPRRRSAAISPDATVVLPTPEWVPATTTRGPSESVDVTSAPPPSVLDPLLGADPLIVSVLHFVHLGDGVGHVDQLVGRVAPGDHHVGARGPAAHAVHHLVHGHPAVLHRVGE